MYAPKAGEREEETFSEDFRERVRDGFCSLFLHGHARREGADFEHVWAGEAVCGFDGHGLKHGCFQRLR